MFYHDNVFFHSMICVSSFTSQKFQFLHNSNGLKCFFIMYASEDCLIFPHTLTTNIAHIDL